MKKIIFFMMITTFNINSLVIQGQLDDAFILNKDTSQHLFFAGLDGLLLFHTHANYSIYNSDILNNLSLHTLVIPFYYGRFSFKSGYRFILYGSPFLFLPLVSLGYIGKWPINNKSEINFDIFYSFGSPGVYSLILTEIESDDISDLMLYYLLNNLEMLTVGGDFGGIYGGIGVKRKINNKETSPLSYKFHIGIMLNGLSAGISFKNSILIGVKRKSSFLSLNPFVNLALRVCFLPTPYFNFSGSPLLSFEPGFEVTSKIMTQRGFIFVSSFMIGYEADFGFSIIRNNFLYMGKLAISASFGIGILSIKKNKNFIM
ncbi:MAG TPA: hypothetical protein PLE45_03160 [Spirochaetota bacterium]|nr:hypothetical protein [Spirochaetota bacterium]HOL56195.1 hypothetical protein [Spirochaetota bacterium]HPP03812.1 hypothetical protein [Spirochaetota bacterium]